MTRRILVHLLGGVVSGAVWGIATRIPFVPVAILLSEAAGIWFSADAFTTRGIARHVARAILVGGTWAAIGMLVFR